MKPGKRKAEEGRRQATDFKEAVCYPSAVVQGAVQRKMVCARGVPGVNWDPREGQQPFRSCLNGVGDRTTNICFVALVVVNNYCTVRRFFNSNAAAIKQCFFGCYFDAVAILKSLFCRSRFFEVA